MADTPKPPHWSNEPLPDEVVQSIYMKHIGENDQTHPIDDVSDVDQAPQDLDMKDMISYCGLKNITTIK